LGWKRPDGYTGWRKQAREVEHTANKFRQQLNVTVTTAITAVTVDHRSFHAHVCCLLTFPTTTAPHGRTTLAAHNGIALILQD
jgi:hypothetical protein